MVLGLGLVFRVQSLGFKVWDFGFRVKSLAFRTGFKELQLRVKQVQSFAGTSGIVQGGHGQYLRRLPGAAIDTLNPNTVSKISNHANT